MRHTRTRAPWGRRPNPGISALLAAATALGLALAGCGSGSTSTANPTASAATAASGVFPVTVGSATVDKAPTKIVSLSPTVTEMLFAIGAGPQVVAVDDQSNYPTNAPKTDLSGFKPNAEAIANKSPDLVVLNSDTNKVVEQLTALKIPVYLAPAAKSLDDSYTEITDLGKLTGRTGGAATTIKQMKDGIAAAVTQVTPRAKKLTYFHELDPTLYTVTSKTFIGSVYSMVGLENIADAADTTGGGYPQLSSEALIKANPDLIFLADSKCCQQSVATLKARPGFADVAAVKNDHVITLDDDVASRWGPRIVDLMRAVAAAVAKVPAA
jgi:cobalamin transport system substrate-binding protein